MVERVTTTKTVETDADTVHETDKTASYSAVDQLVYMIFGIIELLLLARFIFRLTGANPTAGIVDFIYTVTAPLMAPFRFVFPVSQAEGAVFEWSILVAMFFYALLSWIVMRLIRIAYTADK